jgi:hypothetical protein
MKLNFITTLVLTALVVLNGCHSEEEAIQPGQFNFSYKPVTVAGGRTQELATPAFVSYSFTKADGTVVSDKIDLYEFNGSFVTQPQSLNPGEYTLHQFLILDTDSQTIYASPLQDSPLADLVEHPLPLAFIVTNGAVTNVVPEVLAVGDNTPEDFGYVALGFEVVEVASLRIPTLPETEILERIAYQFYNATDTISGEVSLGAMLTIPALLGKTWQSSLQLWVEKECTQYQKLYRFTNELTFEGGD